MQLSKFFLFFALAGAAAIQLSAQPGSPELQGRALDLLHQTIAAERHPATESMLMPMPSRAVSLSQQDQAVQLLRQTIVQDRAATSKPIASSKGKNEKANKTVPPKAAAPTAPAAPSAPHSTHWTPSSATAPAAPAAPTAPVVNSAEPVTSTLSATKQQKLRDLDGLYRADKLTPTEYHAQRAKILSEP